MSDTGFKVGDIVIALKGPHKGDKHKVIHCFDDGSCNIQPLTHRVKYRLGAAKAQPEDIKMAANEADYNKDAVDKESIEMNEENNTKYGVFSKGGSIGSKGGDKPVATFDTKEEAQAKAKSMRKGLSPGERGHYKMSYVVKPIKESQLNENAIDDLKQHMWELSAAYSTVNSIKINKDIARFFDIDTIDYDVLSRYVDKFISQGHDTHALARLIITAPKGHSGKKDESVTETDVQPGEMALYTMPGMKGSIEVKVVRTGFNQAEIEYDNVVGKPITKRVPTKHLKKLNESQLNEGVLDDQDDDGFMAKRQLYDLAKYAVELHRMIQDTDDLEPWVQAKITKAADYIDTVKHYLEYRGVRDADATADVMGPPELGDIDSVGSELDNMLSMETEVMEYGDEDEGSQVYAEDVLRWAVNRGVITPEQEDQALIDQSSPLMMAAQDTADSIGRVWEIGSSDVSIWLRQFVRNCKADGCQLDGERAYLYESQLKAKMIYRNMLRELREKK